MQTTQQSAKDPKLVAKKINLKSKREDAEKRISIASSLFYVIATFNALTAAGIIREFLKMNQAIRELIAVPITVFIVLFALVSIGFIVLALRVKNHPKSSICTGLIIIAFTYLGLMMYNPELFFSGIIGKLITVIGLIVSLVSYYQHKKLLKELDKIQREIDAIQ